MTSPAHKVKSKRHGKVPAQGCNLDGDLSPRSPEGISVLFDVARHASADLQGWPRAKRQADIKRWLSITLQREVAAQLSMWLRVLPT